MNKYRDRIINMGTKNNSRIVLPEISDKRIQEASSELSSMGFHILNPGDFQNKMGYYLDYINDLTFTKNWPIKSLKEYLNDPIHFSMTMLACDDADGVVAGAVTSSSEVIRSAIRIIGIIPSSQWVSSIFFLISPNGEQAYTFGDCAVMPEPDSKQLARIGYDSANFHTLISGEEARVAFLSFSTKGSANHYRVDKVKNAISIFDQNFSHIIHDGELQVDSAVIPEICQIKSPDSPLEGRANVLIFPNLDAGNIAYKIVQHMGGYSAWGPLLQGLNKPIHDLSRGCSVDDIINVTAIASMQNHCHAHI